MKRSATIGAALLSLVVAGTAAAGDRPTPRSSVGSEILDLRSPANDPISQISRAPVAQDQVRVINIGNQELAFAYWDQTAWQTRKIASGSTVELSCPKCGGAIVVAFHDGKQEQRIRATTGSTYVLNWSSQQNAWVLSASGP